MMAETGDVLGRTAALMGGNAVRAGLALTLLTALGFLIDSGLISADAADSLNFPASIATLVLQYWLTRSLLDELGFELSPKSRILAFVGLGIVAGLGILLGLVLLVIPGLVLVARWSIATPLLLGSDRGIFASLEQSWRQTSGFTWPILTSFLVIYLPGVAVAAVGFALMETASVAYGAVLVANLVLNASLIAGWHASVAIFTLINASPRVAEVFE